MIERWNLKRAVPWKTNKRWANCLKDHERVDGWRKDAVRKKERKKQIMAKKVSRRKDRAELNWSKRGVDQEKTPTERRGMGRFCKWSKRCYLMGEKTNKGLGSSRNNSKKAGWWKNKPKRGQADGGKRPNWAELKGRKTQKR
jgi:hypothetical protein